MKRNLRFGTEFPILAKNNSTDSRIEGKVFSNCKNTETDKFILAVKRNLLKCEMEIGKS